MVANEFQFDVFLSHNSADAAVVEELARRLTRAGIRPWLDKWQLIAGKPWQEALEEGLEQSETVAVFIGPAGISPWHNEELRAGIERAVHSRDDFRVIPVLLPGANEQTLVTFLRRREWVNFRDGLDDQDAFARLVTGIQGRPPDRPDTLTLPDEPAPYPGLMAFKPEQAAFFFGRDDDRKRLQERLRDSRFVAIIGASGSGKSSLVMAGLMPALPPSWHALVCVPGARPLRALADQIATLLPIADRLPYVDMLEVRLAQHKDGLETALNTLLVGRTEWATLLIVIDQFEELFTQLTGTPTQKREIQQQFITNLVETVNASRGRIRVVITLRADFVRHCLDFAGLRRILEPNQLLLGAMEEDALREAITRPAQTVGAMFEKGLVSRLLKDMRGHPGALPLLNFALSQLWRQRRGLWLTHAGYDAIGGVSAAIDQRAEAIYNQLSEEDQRLACNLFMRLVALGEDTDDTLRRVQRSELEGVDHLIETLARGDVRLISTEADTVQLAHEALIGQWTRLKEWLSTNRAALRALRELTQAAREWAEHERDESYLFRGTRLAYAEKNVPLQDLNTLEKEFLKASAQAVANAQPRWQPVAGFPEDTVMSLVATPGSPRTYFAGTRNIGMARSRDGMHWTLHRGGLPTDEPGNQVHAMMRLAVDGRDPARLFAFISMYGIYASVDGGETWHAANEGLPGGPDVQATCIDVRGDWVFTVLATPEGSGLYASRNNGDKWELAGGNGQAPLGQAHFACSTPGGDAVYVGAKSGLYVSALGPTWEWRLISELRPVGIMVPDPRSLESFYLAVYISRGQGEIWHWRPGEPGRRLVTVGPIPVAIAPHPDPDAPAVVFVLLQDGKTIALTQRGEYTRLDQIPGMALELLATPHPDDGHPWLLLGHQEGLREYRDPL